MFNILKNCMNFNYDVPFLPEWIKIKNIEKLVANLHDKLNMLLTQEI